MTEEELVQAKCIDVGSLNKDCVCNAAAWWIREGPNGLAHSEQIENAGQS